MKNAVLLALLGFYVIQAQTSDFPLVRRYPAWMENWLDRKAHSKEILEAARPYLEKPKVASTSDLTVIFQDAQREVGIEEGHLLPILEMSERNNKLVAHTGLVEMQVNSEKFKRLLHGAKRQVALHEAFHHKDNDLHVQEWLMHKAAPAATLSTTALSTVCLYKMMSSRVTDYKSWIALAIGAPLISFLVSSVIVGGSIGFFAFNGNYKEFKTDRRAVELLKCHKCVEEASIELGKEEPYFSKADFDLYRDYYKQKNLVCHYHKR